jgi:hypothetical protein
LVKTINQTIVNEGFTSRDIKWDGKDDFGDKLFVDFIFQMDGTEYEIEEAIIEYIHNMIDLFGMYKINYGFKFDTL